jgi:hypothetical protein
MVLRSGKDQLDIEMFLLFETSTTQIDFVNLALTIHL